MSLLWGAKGGIAPPPLVPPRPRLTPLACRPVTSFPEAAANGRRRRLEVSNPAREGQSDSIFGGPLIREGPET